MTQKDKDRIMLTILPKMIEQYLPEYSVYQMMHECYHIISKLEEEGYFPEPPTYRIPSAYELDYPNP